jgi:hypothetical protein
VLIVHLSYYARDVSGSPGIVRPLSSKRLLGLFAAALLACAALLAATAHPAIAGSSPALIAFDDDATGIYEVPVGSPSHETLVAKAGVFPQFSPDGLQLAYEVAHGTGPSDPNEYNTIVIADRNGAAPKTILKGSMQWNGDENGVYYPLAWSTTGKELAYGCDGDQVLDSYGNRDGSQWAQVCVLDVATGQHRMITNPATNDHPLVEAGQAERISWTPDGNIIAAVLDPSPCPAGDASNARCGLPQVGKIDVATGSVQLLTHSYGEAPMISPDGKQILFTEAGTSCNQPYGIQLMNIDGSGQRQLVSACQTNLRWGAIFSPDAKEILYTAYGTADQYHLQGYALPVSGQGTPDMLTEGNVNVYDPVWAPMLTTCTVPNLKHKTLSQAKKLLRKAACALGKVKGPKSHQSKRRVVSQSIKTNTQKAVGARVNVRIQ